MKNQLSQMPHQHLRLARQLIEQFIADMRGPSPIENSHILQQLCKYDEERQVHLPGGNLITIIGNLNRVIALADEPVPCSFPSRTHSESQRIVWERRKVMLFARVAIALLSARVH